MNQCDGCARGLPLVNGIHKGEGWDAIGCTADRYVVAEPLEPSELGSYLVAAAKAFDESGGDINATSVAAAESSRHVSADRMYLESVAALVWRWREEATATEVALDGGEIAAVLRECADELANSLPARIVADAARLAADSDRQ